MARKPARLCGAGESSPRLSELLQHGDIDGRRGRRRHGQRGGFSRRGRRCRAVPLHAAQPIQHVPRGAVRGDVVVHRVAAAEGEAALFRVRRRVRRRVAGVARGLGAAGRVPVRGRRGGAALRRGARPRGARAAAAAVARLLVAAAARAAPRAAPALPPPLGLVRLSALSTAAGHTVWGR